MKRKSMVKRIIFDESGFTLIEMLIVVIVLGILAMIIVPQISVSTEDAKIRTLQTNLSTMRSAIETYYAQHGNTYPGAIKADGSGASDDASKAAAFLQQLTYYSKASGATSVNVDAAFPYGPYIKGGVLPKNPFSETNDYYVDITIIDVTARPLADAATGLGKAWKFFVKTGILIAADGGTSGGTAHTTY